MKCYYCGVDLIIYHPKKGELWPGNLRTRDHIIPQCRQPEGFDTAYSTVNCCLNCNNEKGKLTIEEYRAVLAYRTLGIQVDFKFPGEVNSGQKNLERFDSRRSATIDNRRNDLVETHSDAYFRNTTL